MPVQTPQPDPAPASSRSGANAGVSARRQAWLVVGILALALVWTYWTTLAAMAERWSTDPQYSHGFLVPVFAAVVLWLRRDLWNRMTWQPSSLGLPLLLAGLGLRLLAVRMDIEPLDAFSLLPTLFGLVLMVGGVSVLKWAWPGLAFLAFMLPLPFTAEVALAQPLRRIATVASTYTLQTLGYPAISEGNVILIDEIKLGVVEACSGLGMLMTFFALATAMALVIQAPLLDRVILVVSAIPIAVIANVVRITATGIAHRTVGSQFADVVMHDLAGWLMMPFALLLLWLELRLLNVLLTPRVRDDSAPLSVPGVLTARTAVAAEGQVAARGG